MPDTVVFPRNLDFQELDRRRQSLDSERMFEVLRNFPQQIQQAMSIADSVPTRDRGIQFVETIVVGGMGGSAIGGAVLRDLIHATEEIRRLDVKVHQSYHFPPAQSDRTLAVAVSYSGNTEETLSFAEEARHHTRQVICITSGGKLAELARDYHYVLVLIPSGYQPRCAFGFLFFTLLRLLLRYKVFPGRAEQQFNQSIEETRLLLEQLSSHYSVLVPDNPALQLAAHFYGKIPVFYSSTDHLAAVNARWRAQIQENAKQLAFGNLLPEMNHNEINGWQFPEQLRSAFVPVFFHDPLDHPRIQARVAISADILRQYTQEVFTLEGQGTKFLTRLISLIYLGDWVSYWLALMNNVDPSPVPIIQELKKRLAALPN